MKYRNMKKKVLVLFCVVISTFSFAQNQIELIKDFLPGSEEYFIETQNVFVWDEMGITLFNMVTPETGRELFVTDGTADGTYLLKDICIGADHGAPDSFVKAGDLVYFRAYTNEHGFELWRTDGTSEGTIEVEDLNGTESSIAMFDAGALNNKLFFMAFITSTLGYELCVSDGTVDGTSLFLDIYPIVNESSEPRNFIEFNNKLYFTAQNFDNGRELWVTDGTVDGTYMFADVLAGNASSAPTILGACGGNLFFRAFDGVNDRIFSTNGDVLGSFTELNADAEGGFVDDNYTCYQNMLYFTYNDNVNGNELWRTNGDIAGTELFVDVYPGNDLFGVIANSDFRNLTVFNNKLYFTANTDYLSSRQLFESDGTVGGTAVFNSIPVETMKNVLQLQVCNNRLFMYAEYPQYLQLMSIGISSDELVLHSGENINFNVEDFSNINLFFNMGDTLCMIADFQNGLGTELYKLYYDEFVDAESLENDLNSSFYPNPATNNITVDPQSESEYSVNITDVTGKIISTLGSLNGTNNIDLSDFQSGMYLLQLNVNGIVKTEKLLITK
jgi:ELWxxDGT repeat protein